MPGIFVDTMKNEESAHPIFTKNGLTIHTTQYYATLVYIIGVGTCSIRDVGGLSQTWPIVDYM